MLEKMEKKLNSSGYRCIIAGCPNEKSNTKIKYHAVPRNPTVAALWIQCSEKLRKLDPDDPAVTCSRNAACGRHFLDKQFRNHLKKKLNPRVVPTINLGNSEDDKKKEGNEVPNEATVTPTSTPSPDQQAAIVQPRSPHLQREVVEEAEKEPPKNGRQEEGMDRTVLNDVWRQKQLPALRLVPVELMRESDCDELMPDATHFELTVLDNAKDDLDPDCIVLDCESSDQTELAPIVVAEESEHQIQQPVINQNLALPPLETEVLNYTELTTALDEPNNEATTTILGEPNTEPTTDLDEPKEKSYIFNSVKMYHEGMNVDICRLCLSPLTTISFKLFDDKNPTKSKDLMQIVNFVFPHLNLDVYPFPSICMRCKSLLEYSAELKLNHLNAEETLKKYIDGKPTADDKPINIVILPDNLKDILVNRHDIVPLNSDEQFLINNNIIVQIENLGPPPPEETHVPIQREIVRIRPPRVSSSGPRPHDYGEGPYLCPFCGHFFEQLNIYRRHIIKHNRHRTCFESFFCEICCCTISNNTKRRHYLAHETPRYSCDVCDKKFHYKHFLRKHTEARHSLTTKLKQCHLCGKMMTQHALWHHLLVHDPKRKKRYKCHSCDMAFMYPHILKKHLTRSRAHNDTKVSCPYCGKHLHYEANLKRHIEVFHQKTIEADRYCPLCKRGFYTPSALRKHMYAKHVPREEEREDEDKLQIVYRD